MRNLRWIFGLIGILLLPGCGGSTTPTTPATPAPTAAPCTQSTVRQVNDSVGSLTLFYIPFSTNTSGRLDITVDWTFPATPLGVYVVNAGSCAIDQFNADTCNYLVSSETFVKPRKVSVANTNAGNFELLVANFSDTDESISGQVVLSSPTCPAFVSSPPAASWSGRSVPLTGVTLR
jgi:hypothetical protein